MSTLKLISALMDYPRDELWQHGDELRAAAKSISFDRATLSHFVEELLSLEPMQAQERWLLLFDRGRSMSLLVFEHIHGESRDRGQAMVNLLEVYRQHGFRCTPQPDQRRHIHVPGYYYKTQRETPVII